MANDKKMVEAITSMDEDFAQWYTDVVLKAGLIASAGFYCQSFFHFPYPNIEVPHSLTCKLNL